MCVRVVGDAVVCTLSLTQVLLEKADGGGFVVIEEAVGVLKALIELADVFLINEVGDEAESAQALQKLRETGCLLAKEASQQQQRGVAEHVSSGCSAIRCSDRGWKRNQGGAVKGPGGWASGLRRLTTRLLLRLVVVVLTESALLLDRYRAASDRAAAAPSAARRP